MGHPSAHSMACTADPVLGLRSLLLLLIILLVVIIIIDILTITKFINLKYYIALIIFNTYFGPIQTLSTPYELGRSLNQIVIESQCRALVPKPHQSN